MIKNYFMAICCLCIAIGLMAQNSRQVVSLNSGWKFKTSISTVTPASVVYDDSSWGIINIPHTWNNLDGQDGGNNFLRTDSWYRKTINCDASYLGKKAYLQFLGVNMQCVVYLNGDSVGAHKGGYGEFRIDVTNKLIQGNNLIAVKVNNQYVQDIAPLTADFTFFGGIYREVSLVLTNPLHVDMMDNGSSGLYLTTTNVSPASATLGIKSNIVNDGASSKTVTVTAVLRYPDTFDSVPEISKTPFSISSMKPGGGALQTVTETVTIPAGSIYSFTKQMTVSNPHLWNGKTDPFRYLVDMTVKEGVDTLDMKSSYVGFRYFSCTNNGFFLNGNLYPLRGVNRHQDRQDMGNAITDKEHREDFALIYQMGANSMRLAHYPQANYFYDMCDRYGIVVWAEIPFVDLHGTASNFVDVTKQQLVELIRQQYNRPSIVMWGLQNEVKSTYDTQMRVTMKTLNDLAHAEDPTRYTVQATNHGTAYNWPSDLMAWNTYPGWYGGGSLSSQIAGYITRTQPTGLSEYGAGGSINQHELNPAQPVTTGTWHPEEYQTLMHEQHIAALMAQPKLWGSFLWNMFDFAADMRSEGDHMGRNDKGTVTYDRKTKKDSYFVYKVNWNSEPMTYITRRRFNPMPQNDIPVTVYSNCDSVQLIVNGTPVSTIKKASTSNCIYKWPSIILATGSNTVIAKGMKAGVLYNDTIVWNKLIGTDCLLTSTSLRVDTTSKRIVLTAPMLYTSFVAALVAKNNATFKVFNIDGITVVTSGTVVTGMKVIVTAEDGVTKKTYAIVSDNLSYLKTILADSQQSGNPATNAVDMNGTTRWAANDGASHYIEVDLGDVYNLNKVAITWYNSTAGTRYYKYKIYVADNSKNYTQAIDRTTNTTVNTVTDGLTGTGRWVKVLVTGSNDASAYPSLYELEVYGWKIQSSKYIIDNSAKTIQVAAQDISSNTQTGTFLSNISLMGQGSLSLNSNSYFIQVGDKLTVTDINGIKTDYTIQATDNPIRDISTGKISMASGQEGVDDASTSQNLVSYINDGDLGTRWAAPKRNGIPKYPEWAIIDLGNTYNVNGVELYFYQWGQNNRSYKYELLGSTTDTIASHFAQLTNNLANTDKTGHYLYSYANVQARFVKVNVTGCDLSTAQASLYEMKVTGYLPTMMGTNELKASILKQYSVKDQTLFVELENSDLIAQLFIYNYNGQLLSQQSFKKETSLKLQKGIYIVSILSDKNSLHFKCLI